MIDISENYFLTSDIGCPTVLSLYHSLHFCFILTIWFSYINYNQSIPAKKAKKNLENQEIPPLKKQKITHLHEENVWILKIKIICFLYLKNFSMP